MIANKFSVREYNETLVLSTIIHNPEISRASISQLTGLNKASTSEIVKKFIEDGLINEIGIGSSTSSGGRKPIQLEMNGEAGRSLGIDIGYDYLHSMLTNLNGDIIEVNRHEGIMVTKENVISEIDAIIEEMSPHFLNTQYQLIGITIAIHGIVNENKIVFTPYADLHEIDIAQLLEEKWDIPVYVENEANLSVLGEKSFTTPKDNMVSVSIHNGIGAGILIDGELYRGNYGRGGEIGHMIIQPHGRSCPCGNKGCMEQYCSAYTILKDYRKLINHPDAAFEQLRDDFEKNHSEVKVLVENAADFLAFGLNNVITNFDPEIVVLNSILFDELPFLLGMIKERIDNRFASEIPLITSTLENHATLLGATIVNLQNFFHIKNLNFYRNISVEV